MNPQPERPWPRDSQLRNRVGHHKLHRANEWTDPWLQHIESKGWTDLHAALRNRYRGQAVAEANQSYWRHLPDSPSERVQLDAMVPPRPRG